MNILRLLLLPLFAFGTVNALQLNGRLTDEEFKESKDIRIELVEQGSILEILYNEPFSLMLLQDTVWNLCVYDDSKEKYRESAVRKRKGAGVKPWREYREYDFILDLQND